MELGLGGRGPDGAMVFVVPQESRGFLPYLGGPTALGEGLEGPQPPQWASLKLKITPFGE